MESNFSNHLSWFQHRQRRDDTRAGHGGHQERQICQTNHQNCLPRDTGKTEEANNVKKQLPFRTLTANYRERRLAYGIIRYNPIITLDLDELEEDRLEAIRSLINNDPNTLGSFLSPKRHGYKIFVFRQTEYACRLRAELLQGEIDYGCLEEVHSKLYNDAKQYYEALLGTEIDGSGKNISRGYFISYDPEAI